MIWLLGLLMFNEAAAVEPIKLRSLGIDYRNYSIVNPNARNPLITPEPPKDGLDLNLQIDFMSYIYWDSTIHSVTTSAQYRGVGLETRLGINITDHLATGLYHHSQHVLDRNHSGMKFPVEDAWEIRIKVFQAPEKRSSVF